MAIGTLAAIGLGAAGIGSAISGSKQASAAKKAAQLATDTSLQVAEKNNALAREIYGENKAMLSPFVSRGNQAAEGINALLAGDQSAFDRFRNSSGYKFRLNEGINALNSGYAGAGTLQSGAAMKGITRFGQEFASNELGNYMNILGNQQGVGLSGASALAGVGQNYVNTIGSNNSQAGDTAINAALYRANNTQSPFGNALSLVGGGLFGFGR